MTPRRRGAALAVALVAALLLAACAAPGAGAPPRPSAVPASSAATRSTAAPDRGVVVGLGDSVTAGTACGCATFLELYAAGLAQRGHRPVRAVNLGRPGLTSVDLGKQLTSTAVRAQLARADTVVVTAGANDLVPLVRTWRSGRCPTACIAPAVSAMGTHLRTALVALRTELPPGARVLVTTYWNVFEDGDVADRLYGDGFGDWSDAVTRAADTAISEATAAAQDRSVDLYAPFEGAGDRNPTTLLAEDGDHPNAAGHRLIAQTLLAAS